MVQAEQPGPEAAGGQISRGFFSLAADVFLEPRRAFADIAQRPNFIAPMVAAVISGVVVAETMLWYIGMERVIRNSLEMGGQVARMGPDQLEQAVSEGARVATIFAHVGGVLGPVIFLCVIAAVGLGVSNVVFGGQANYRTSLAVTAYAHLPMVLAALLALPVILLGDVDRFNPQNPAPTNLGFFLNPYETSKPLLALASSLDLFTFWFLALLGVGFSAALRGRTSAWAFGGTLAALWAVWVLGKVGLAMLGS